MSDSAPEWAATLAPPVALRRRDQLRDELAALVLPPLLTCPGCAPCGACGTAPTTGVLEYRWAGLPLEDDVRRDFAGRAALAGGGALRTHGIADVLVHRIDVAGEASGTFLVGVDDSADVPVSRPACPRSST